jgi:Rrf2 family protein
MLLNRSAQYTLQALIYLASQPRDQLLLVREIANQLGIPPLYLSKLMQPASRAGWLITLRGRGGGICLAPGAENLTLMDVLQLTESHRISRECLLGFKACEDETACVMHCQWKPIKQELAEGLGSYSLVALAAAALPPWLLGEVEDRLK